jgi:hypothetical protein
MRGALISGSGIDSVSTFLAIAGKYPAAASLREQAWRKPNAPTSLCLVLAMTDLNVSAPTSPRHCERSEDSMGSG